MRRGGEYADIPPGALLAIRRKHSLSQAQLAMLAGSSVFKTRRGVLQARRVQAWESGEHRMPFHNWELLKVRLFLLERGMATFEELATLSLVDLVQRNIDVTKMTESIKSLCPQEEHGERLEEQSA